MADTRNEMFARRWAELLRRWLAALPAEGWSGSPAELSAVLDQADAELRTFARVPGSHAIVRALAEAEQILAAAGWSSASRRTAKGRLIVVEPSRA